MNKEVVYRDHWDSLLIEIIDNRDERSLFFGGEVLQSSMSLTSPCRLVLSYTRFMMAALLINEAPERILIIGVGAGSLVRFFHHYLPFSNIVGVDNAPHIIKLAHGYFQLPDDKRVTIHCMDGHAFLGNQAPTSLYDLILLDAFDGAGMAPSVYHADCYTLCRKHLHRDGCLVINLWSGDAARMNTVQDDVAASFEATLNLPVPNRGNVICLAGRQEIIDKTTRRSRNELTLLSKRFDIDFQVIVRSCRLSTPGQQHWLGRLFG